MTRDDEKLLTQAADAKLVRMNEQVLFPLLVRRIEQSTADLCESFKHDGTVKVQAVAYIAALRDIMTELTQVARHGERAAEKLNLNPPL
jgi:hypothetical protein